MYGFSLSSISIKYIWRLGNAVGQQDVQMLVNGIYMHISMIVFGLNGPILSCEYTKYIIILSCKMQKLSARELNWFPSSFADPIFKAETLLYYYHWTKIIVLPSILEGPKSEIQMYFCCTKNIRCGSKEIICIVWKEKKIYVMRIILLDLLVLFVCVCVCLRACTGNWCSIEMASTKGIIICMRFRLIGNYKYKIGIYTMNDE